MKELIWIPLLCCAVLLAYSLLWCRSRKCFIFAWFSLSTSSLLTALFLVADNFTGEGVNESAVFHLLHGINLDILTSFIDVALPFVGLIFLLTVLLLVGVRLASFRKTKKLTKFKLVELVLLAITAGFAVVAHPAAFQIVDIGKSLYAAGKYDALSAELIEERSPHPLRRRSLVYIYVESFERTFLNKDIFPGLAQNVAGLERESLSFSGIRQAPMTGWTIAGMVASQCGVPLATFRSDRNDLSDKRSFVPGVTCIGDLLFEGGWRLAYLGGADLNFAGKGNFYRSHGFQDVTGKEEIVARRGKTEPLSKWGIYDETLFEEALRKIDDLAAQEGPFALFMLTLDTHPPSGFMSGSCADRVDTSLPPILQAVQCTDQMIMELVRAIEARNIEDLVIVIASDHLQMRNDVSGLLDQHGRERGNLFIVRSSELVPQMVKREATTLDIAPTLMSLLGWPSAALGLGRDLLGDKPTLMERYGEGDFFSMIEAARLQMWSIWRQED